MRVIRGFMLAGLLGVVGCDDGDGGLSSSGISDPGKRICLDDVDCRGGEVCFAGECVYQGSPPLPSDPDARDDLPVEDEQRFSAQVRPAAGAEHVFVPRPAADSVARIHGETLAIEAIEVGDGPTVVRLAPGSDRAVVLNEGSGELAIIDGATDPRFVLLDGYFNALDLTADGRYALCWFDLSRAGSTDRVDSLQDLVVVDLETDARHQVTIGFRPRRVQLAADGQTVFVVTDDGISVVRPAELGASTLAITVPVAPDVFHEVDREVLLTADGRWAISRGPGEAGVTLVELAEGVPRFIPLPGEPTDVDLLPDGTAALVMLRAQRRLALIVLARAAEAPEAPEAVQFVEFPEHVLGSAVVTDQLALLYTTQQQTRPQISLLHLDTLDLVHRPMRKSIAGVEIAPDGQTAVVLHHAGDTPVDPSDPAFIEQTAGYSLMDLRTARVKLQTTPAPPTGLVFAADRDEAYLLLRGDDVAAVQRIDLRGFAVQTWALGTPPEFIGVLPALDRAFVTQTHPEGRISFIHLDADFEEGGRLETVSGYTLNGRID